MHPVFVRARIDVVIELGGGLLKKDFREIDEESSPVYSLHGSLFVVLGKVSHIVCKC